MAYKINEADLNSLRYIHAFYTYLRHDIKLPLDERRAFQEEAKALFNKFSSAIVKVAQREYMLTVFEEIIEEFKEDVKTESIPKKRYPKPAKEKESSDDE